MALLKVGILGLGRMGKLHLMNALHIKGVKVAAVADRKRSNLRIAERLKVQNYKDYRELIDSENIDVVVISLPNFLKRESIAYALEKNLDIFLEKPIARNFIEASEIVESTRRQGTRLMVGVNCRYFDSIQKLKMMLDEGRLGDIVIANSELVVNGPFSHPLEPKPVPSWWFDREKAGGGALLDLGYHLLDIYNWMFGDLEVSGSFLDYRFNLPVEDGATVIVRSRKTGTRGVINVGWFSKTIFPQYNFRVNLHGTVGYGSTDHFSPRNLYVHAIKTACSNVARRILGKEIRPLHYTYFYSSYFTELRNFFRLLEEGSEMPVSLSGQLEVMKIIDAISNQGAPVNG